MFVKFFFYYYKNMFFYYSKCKLGCIITTYLLKAKKQTRKCSLSPPQTNVNKVNDLRLGEGERSCKRSSPYLLLFSTLAQFCGLIKVKG